MDKLPVYLFEKSLEYIGQSRLKNRALNEIACIGPVMCEKARPILWRDIDISGRISEKFIAENPGRQYVQCITIWGLSKIVLAEKLETPTILENSNDDDGNGSGLMLAEPESEFQIIEEIDLEEHPLVFMKKLQHLFPNANTIQFMLVRDPATLLSYICENWPTISKIEFSCHIGSSGISYSSRTPEMTEIIAAHPNIIKELSLERWYSDKNFIAALLRSQKLLNKLCIYTYMDSFDNAEDITLSSLTSIQLHYIKWTNANQVLDITSKMFPSLQYFQMLYIENRTGITNRCSIMFSKLFSSVWENLLVIDIPFITDTIAISISKTCPQLCSFKSEGIYNFTLPDHATNLGSDNDIDNYILTNRGFIIMVTSLDNLKEFELGMSLASSCHFLDQGLIIEDNSNPLYHNSSMNNGLIPWECTDMRILKIRMLWLPINVYGILLQTLPYLHKFIFEITDPNTDMLEQTWIQHQYLQEIELRFQAESSPEFCRKVFEMLPNLTTVTLANCSFDIKTFAKEYPRISFQKIR